MPHLSSPSGRFRSRVAEIVGPDGFKDDLTTLLQYSRDLWPLLTLRLREGVLERRADVVAWPADEQQVLDLLQLAHDERVPLIPYGGGAGVCGGAMPTRGGLVLDLKRINRLVEVDEAAHAMEVEPGIIGETLERQLIARGFTSGHYPSSILCSSVGGFLAARSAGQCSTRYGKIEDMVLGMRIATPGMGMLETGVYAADAGGVDLSPVILGSEGTLGVITRARIRIFPLPEARRFRGLRFGSVRDGLTAFRRILQMDLRPSVLRLYDPLDTLFAMSLTHGADSDEDASPGPLKRLSSRMKHAMKPEELPLGQVLKGAQAINMAAGMARSCLAVIGFEGDADAVAEAEAEALAVVEDGRGEDLGPEPGERWYASRYHISFKLPKVLQQDAFADTIEVASTWDRLPTLYREVRRAIAPHAVVLAHFSHAYPEGCSIYFSISGTATSLAEAEARYERIWEEAMRTALEVGGTVTHHHGTGMLKRRYTAREHGHGRALYDLVKRRCDPHGVCNPDKLYPPDLGAR
jgi:alkyldihydroxyacetonephosphate synthase